MLAAFGLTLLGLAVLLAGAELLTRGGGNLAAQLGIPPLIIGLTVVAIGTSAPELAIGIEAALHGNGALAVGNIAGTNTVNILLILGLSALILPLPLKLQTLRTDLPTMVLAGVTMLWMSLDGHLSRSEGGVLVIAGLAYTAVVLLAARQESYITRTSYAEEFSVEQRPGIGDTVVPCLMLLAGIAVIVFGADWFVDGIVRLARLWGVSDAFIGLTVVAIGTSAPELVTTLVSTLRGQRDIAIGNLLGSSVYNIFFILGITCLVPAAGIPVPRELVRVDIPVMTLVALACVPVFRSGGMITRREGGAFVLAYLAYLAYLLAARTGA